MATLSIIQGFLGAGKTTFSKRLASETHAVRLNADEWCEQNFSEAQLNHDWDACFGQAVQLLWDEAERLLASDSDVILDIGFWSRASRDHARDKAQEFGAGFKLYYIFAPDDVLLSRIRQRSGGIAERNVANFHEIKKAFEPPGADEQAIVVNNY